MNVVGRIAFGGNVVADLAHRLAGIVELQGSLFWIFIASE